MLSFNYHNIVDTLSPVWIKDMQISLPIMMKLDTVEKVSGFG
jgi:hypothetical protein